MNFYPHQHLTGFGSTDSAYGMFGTVPATPPSPWPPKLPPDSNPGPQVKAFWKDPYYETPRCSSGGTGLILPLALVAAAGAAAYYLFVRAPKAS